MKPRPFATTRVASPLTAALAALLAAPAVHATSDTWNVDAAGNWATNGSWLSGTQAPGSTTANSTDVATFSKLLTADRIVTVDTNRYIGGISFSNTSNFKYTLGTGILHLNSGGVIQTLASNGNHTDTISSAIVISGTTAATATFTAGATSATSLLSIGAVTGSATSGNTTTLTLNGTNTGANAITGVIGNGAGTGKLALTKSGTGTWTLSGTNTYSGGTTISGGTIIAKNSSAMGTSTVAINSGALQLNTSSGALNLTNTISGGGTVEFVGNSTNRGQLTGDVSGFTGDFHVLSTGVFAAWNGSSAIATTNQSVTIDTGGFLAILCVSPTLTVNFGALNGNGSVNTNGGTSNSGILSIGNGGANGSFSGVISNSNLTTGTLSLMKAGTGTQTLGGANTYTGSTIIGGGTLADTADNTGVKGLYFGATAGGTTVGTLDLTVANVTTTGLTVQTNSTSTNTITIGTGKTLTTNGAVTIGPGLNQAGSNTKLAVTGAGAWNVVNSGGTFQVGKSASSSGYGTSGNTGNLDLSGLGTFSANLSTTGTFRVGDFAGDGTGMAGSTAILAATSTITGGTLALGDATTADSVQALKLGSGTQVLNVNTINLGMTGTVGRSSGSLTFNSSSGTLKVRAANGTGSAALNMYTGNTSTGTLLANVFDVTGHSADLLFSTANLMSGTMTGANPYTSTFSFDTGTLGITTLNLGTKAGAGAATNVATMNIGSAVGNFTNTATLGAVTMATMSGTTGGIAGNLYIKGSATTVGITSLTVAKDTAATGGTATGLVAISGGTTTVTGGITLAARTSAGTVNGTLNLTGGSLTVGGNIVTTGTGGTVTTTLTLDGGSLDMGGHAIGGAGQLITNLNFQSGTLKNVSEINNGAGLTKTGSGTLVLAGTNTYTGATTITTGMLQVDGSTAAGSTVAIGTAGTLTGTGTVNGNATLTGGGIINKASGMIAGTLGVTGGNWNGAASVTGTVTSGSGTFTIGSGADLTAIAGLDITGGSIVAGSSSSTITGSVNYTSPSGSTFDGIIAGAGQTLTMNSAAAKLTLTGTNTYSGLTTISNGTLLVNGTNSGSGAVNVNGGTLGGTGSIAGAVLVNDGGTLAPGASIASLSVGGDLSFGDGSTFAYEMNHSADASVAGDLQIVNGDGIGDSLSLAKADGNKVYLTLTDLAGTPGAFAPNTTTLSLIQYVGTWNGGFFTYGTEELADGEQFTDAYHNHWTIRYGADTGGMNFATNIPDSHFITLSNLTAIPEPGTLLALGCLVGSGMFLRSRRKQVGTSGLACP